MTMPDWPKLWAREPSLKPKLIEIVDAIDPARPDHAPWGKIPREDHKYITAELCGFAVVRWLIDNRILLHFQKDPKYRIWVNDMRTQDTVPPKIECEHVHDTLDSALYAAVDAVLTAEGK